MKTGQRYRIETQHNLFFIPMHYWGPAGLVIGFVLIVASILYNVDWKTRAIPNTAMRASHSHCGVFSF
ncbi:hypothetical protein [Paenibacillus polymyxa]|uniref:hypothetical protein n=1 Tax=Paenibacillus polymyxa TaxID=1406 RepID=UPI0025B6A3D0|nr:hypothetical protein [Paenibacillus polymyxa]MDN4088677.1 hypothetical protein [Paenibacillus polymyxa]